MKLYQATRSKKLGSLFSELGLCITNSRLASVLESMEATAVDTYEKEGLVFPLTLPKGVFVTVQADNIDSKSSDFHGTGISVATHPTKEDAGTKAAFPAMIQSNTNRTLPESFSVVKPAYLPNNEPMLPPLPGHILQPSITHVLRDAKGKENLWMDTCTAALAPEVSQDIEGEDSANTARASATTDTTKVLSVGWSAFFAQSLDEIPIPTEAAMLPLFKEKAATPAMMKHSMEVAIAVTRKLNPGQTPVLTLDQPLYALAKQLQWQHPEDLGEDKFVVMAGGLHIEMAIITTIGTLLEMSGWCEAVSTAGITTPGRAQSLTGSKHVKNAR